jgi:ethanolamine utilization protein EutQ (cupin superfamily)
VRVVGVKQRMQPCSARYCKAKAVSSRSRIAHVKLTTSEAGISRRVATNQPRFACLDCLVVLNQSNHASVHYISNQSI